MQKLEKKEICPKKIEALYEIVRDLLTSSFNEETRHAS